MTTPAPAPAKTPAKSTATLHVKADTSHAVADLEALALAYAHTAPKNGWRTSELWVTLLTLLDDLLLARYGHDWGLAGNLPTVAALASTLLSGAYVAARTWLKARHVQASTVKDAGHADSMLLLFVAVLVLLLALGVVPR